MIDQNIQVFDSTPQLQSACANEVASALQPSADGQVLSLVLSGGSTPRAMHRMLAEMPGINWSNIHVFWGDERTVPPDHEESNYRMAKESLLDLVDIPEENVHRMRGELDPERAADEYEAEIREVLNLQPGELPEFDVVLLGMGADGHTASLFPGTDALHEEERLVVANHVPQLDTMRLTLTYPVLNNARKVIFLVAGEDKAPAASECLFSPESHPASRVQPTDGELHWFLDAAAAAEIES